MGGAAVVLNYRTGEILCSTSWPSFDPRNVQAVLDGREEDASLYNRVTQGLYPPGSTFKIVTMASALNYLPDAALRTYVCTGALDIENTTVDEAGGSVHGENTLNMAFAKSCNTAFASLALELGASRLRKTASDFGVGNNFLFQDLIVYNSQFPSGTLTADNLAWAGIGQDRVLVTPLHMAMIAAAVGNDGVMMEPRLLLSGHVGTGPRTGAAAVADVQARLQRSGGFCFDGGDGCLRGEWDGYAGAHRRLHRGRQNGQRRGQRR